MAITYGKQFQPQTVPNANTTIFTVPTSPATNLLINGRVRFANNSGSAATISAWCVPSGGAVANSNLIVNAKSIAPNDYWDTDIDLMAAGDFFVANAGTANAITVSQLDGVLHS